jgi:hypothetical protein
MPAGNSSGIVERLPSVGPRFRRGLIFRLVAEIAIVAAEIGFGLAVVGRLVMGAFGAHAL